MSVAEAHSSGRWVAIAGLLACLTFVLSFLIPLGAPEAIRSDEKILDWYLHSTNQYRFVVAAFTAGIGSMAFLVFVVGFRRLLVARHGDDALSDVVYAAGLVVAAMAMVEVAIGSSVAGTLIFSDRFQLDPDSARLVLTIGNVWMPAFSGIPAAFFLAAGSLAARRGAVLPSWLTWTGFVLVVPSVLVVPGFGANGFVVLLWVLLASIVLLRSRPRLIEAGA